MLESKNYMKLEKEILNAFEDRVILDELHGESVSNKIYHIYRSAHEMSQKKAIRKIIYDMLYYYYITKPLVDLDEKSEKMLCDLAYISELLKLKRSYKILRSIIDRGSLGIGDNIFSNKISEKKVLRAIASIQPKFLLSDTLWYAYWVNGDEYFWDLSFLGLVQSNIDIAIQELTIGYQRWKDKPTCFDFPQALWEIAKHITNDKLNIAKSALKKIDDKTLLQLEDILIDKGMSYNKIYNLLPNLRLFYQIKDTKLNREKLFYIYFHRDMDGIGSAVLLSLILIKKYNHNKNKIRYIPVDYDKKDKWSDIKFKKPFAILDFLYHKDAIIYFDHHQSPFINNDFKQHYELRASEGYIKLDRNSFSTTQLIFNEFNIFFKDNISDRYNELNEFVEQISMIDRGMFKSPNLLECLDLECYNFNLILFNDRTDSFSIQLIQEFIDNNFKSVLYKDEYEKRLLRSKALYQSNLDKIETRLEQFGKIIFYNSVDPTNLPYYRFVPYHFYPKSNFVVGIYKKRKNYFEVSVGRNPWKEKTLGIDIGELCQSFGGGGHKDVGGITTNNYGTAYNIARRISHILESPKFIDNLCDTCKADIGLLNKNVSENNLTK